MKKFLTLALVMLTLICILASCEVEISLVPSTTTNNKTFPHTHEYGEWDITQKVTCTEDGLKVRYCSCGEKQSEVVLALGHVPAEPVEEKRVEATCTTNGSCEKVVYCDHGCGTEFSRTTESILSEGHKESDWIIDLEATEENEGSKHTECLVCNEVLKTDVIEKILCDIVLWVSTTTGVKEITEAQVAAFKAATGYNFNIKIETVGEGDAASEILKDVATAPDMYCFSQDQISRLVQAGALAPLDTSYSSIVSTNNDMGAVNAATVNGQIYAYPMTSDNGYFLYYDSSIISDEEAQTLEGIIEACKRSGKKFGYNLTNGWYTAGFFFSQPVGGGGKPLCLSTWTYSEGSRYPIAVNDTFNSANGLIAMKAMNALANSGVWVDQADDFANTAAIVTGIWNANQAAAYYGNNMKATKLPTFVGSDGQTYQMGSFSGNKLLGCKPQTDETKAKICAELAMYLTSGEAQLERYYEFGWGPSNLEAQANQDVSGDIVLAALLAQNVYSVPQGVIPNDWWMEAAILGMVAQDDKTEADFLAALAAYEEKINGMIVK